MNSALAQIAAAVGFVLFLVAMAAGLLLGVPVLTALYRALMIMIIGSVIATFFFQFFAKVLYSFIREQQELLHKQEEAKREAERKAKQEQRVAGRGPE